MEKIYEGLVHIVLTDKNGKEFTLKPQSFEEMGDELIVRTHIKNEDFQRGWIGDLKYILNSGIDFAKGEYTDGTEEDTFKDVLLTKVRIWSCEIREAVIWEYVFLKK